MFARAFLEFEQYRVHHPLFQFITAVGSSFILPSFQFFFLFFFHNSIAGREMKRTDRGLMIKRRKKQRGFFGFLFCRSKGFCFRRKRIRRLLKKLLFLLPAILLSSSALFIISSFLNYALFYLYNFPYSFVPI